MLYQETAILFHSPVSNCQRGPGFSHALSLFNVRMFDSAFYLDIAHKQLENSTVVPVF